MAQKRSSFSTLVVLAAILAGVWLYFTPYLALNQLPMPSRAGLAGVFNRAFFWTDERATLPYDLWVIAILSFVWLIVRAVWVLIGNEQQRTFLSGSSTRTNQLARISE